MGRPAPTTRSSRATEHSTSKRVAILQSSYIPWKGYFDIIASVDEFILYDAVSYSKGDWRNRNRIKTDSGLAWLTVPACTSGRFGQPIHEVEVRDTRWASKHWKSLETYYARAQGFDELAPTLRETYERAASETRLSRINELFIERICALLGIRTKITRSSDYTLHGNRTERLAHLCEQAGAKEYLSGPSAKAYLDTGVFSDRGIAVCWMDYSGYPEYRQLHGSLFVHQVSILDLLLNEGAANARRYMLACRGERAGSWQPNGAEGRACSSLS